MHIPSREVILSGTLVVGAFVAICLLNLLSVRSADAAEGVMFTSDNALVRPEGYREWIYVGTPHTPNDMNNGNAPFPEFHNVYIDPEGLVTNVPE